MSSRSEKALGRPLRVAHVIGGGDTGGAMSYLLPLITALRADGCDARLICLGAGGLADAAAEKELPCDVLAMRSPWDVRVLPGLRRRIVTGSWDVVHTHGMRANLPVRALAGVMRRRFALLTTVHSELALDYPGVVQSRMYGFLDRMSAGAVDGFFCVSEDFAAKLVARGIPESRIQVVHPGIEPPDEMATATDPVVGTVARLVAVKDIGLLLSAARLLRERVPGFRLVVAGDGPERAALEREAEGLGLGPVVEFLGTALDVWPVLRRFQVYALTSASEGVPLSVLEAMSVGLPVVATAVGGLPEIISDGVNGYLVGRDSREIAVERLAERIGALLADPGLRARIGVAARERVMEAFTPAAAAKTTMRCYRRTVAARTDRHDRGEW